MFTNSLMPSGLKLESFARVRPSLSQGVLVTGNHLPADIYATIIESYRACLQANHSR